MATKVAAKLLKKSVPQLRLEDKIAKTPVQTIKKHNQNPMTFIG